ncbi:MAG TPA: hypothetical protein QF533_01935 [Nitrospinota bacterium]|nr:hypothetical protein [Nitrospinota bacterium]
MALASGVAWGDGGGEGREGRVDTFGLVACAVGLGRVMDTGRCGVRGGIFEARVPPAVQPEAIKIVA